MNENLSSPHPVSTFGHIYNKALQAQLQKMGYTLRLLRKTRKEDIDTVAAAVDIRPELLGKIENGQHDMRVKTFFALCDYYEIDHRLVIGKGELMQFRFE